MNNVVTDTEINFTDAAVNKVAALILDEKDLSLNLRVYITGGGCSGFQYGFTFDQEIREDDLVVTKSYNDENLKAVKLLIDPLSLQYLIGADIDYKEDLSGAQFVIRNPNAKTTCGCGSSFSIGDDD
tara:strand:- start:494 stop:874 length:381 start_codon:yes stop_codon:yes gene_type:complete